MWPARKILDRGPAVAHLAVKLPMAGFSKLDGTGRVLQWPGPRFQACAGPGRRPRQTSSAAGRPPGHGTPTFGAPRQRSVGGVAATGSLP